MPHGFSARVPAALLTLWGGAWLFLATGGCGTYLNVNVLVDRDGNGLPDSVIVGDFNHNGVLEMDDIQDAIDALTDPGPKSITVLGGDFIGPTQPQLRPGRDHAILELRSHTTLTCAGVGITILHAAPLSPSYDYAVIANDDHVNGNVGVEIHDCEIDGGAPDVYDGSLTRNAQHRGVFFRYTTDGVVSGSYIHNFVHAGLYTSNSTNDRFVDNVVDHAGDWGDTRTTSRQPCIYAFAYGGHETVGFVAARNKLSRCAFGLNTRAEHTDVPGDVIRNLLWEDNTLENMMIACIALRGVDGAIVRRNTCHSAGAFQLVRADYGTGYRWQGNDNANSNVLIEDIEVSGTQIGQAALDIGAFVDGLTIRRFSVLGVGSYESGTPLPIDCVNIQRPLRNAVLEDMQLRECGRSGFVVRSVASPSGDPAETLVFRSSTLAGVDFAGPTDTQPASGLRFVGAQGQLDLEDLRISGATGPEVAFEGAASDVLMRNVVIRSLDPGWVGAGPEASVPVCDALLEGRWVLTTDATSVLDCDFTPGTTGLAQARCGCAGGVWSPITWAASPGVVFASGVVNGPVTLDNVSVSNARGVTGIRVGGALTNFQALSVTGIDDSPATDLPQRSAIDFEAATGWTVGSATCIGTAPGVPCVE